ncbi:MAG: hypothetical protein Q4C98_09835 [Capnocytophaga sp.]|nr:hypothetical protein [Capnocytophaga sp.]
MNKASTSLSLTACVISSEVEKYIEEERNKTKQIGFQLRSA